MKKIKNARIPKLEKKLTTLKKIKCSPRLKRKLRKMARDWISWIKQHMEDIHKDAKGNYEFHNYHKGGINILEILFNIKKKNEKNKNNQGKRKNS